MGHYGISVTRKGWVVLLLQEMRIRQNMDQVNSFNDTDLMCHFLKGDCRKETLRLRFGLVD